MPIYRKVAYEQPFGGFEIKCEYVDPQEAKDQAAGNMNTYNPMTPSYRNDPLYNAAKKRR